MVDRGKVGFPTLFRRRTDANENHFSRPDGFAGIRCVRDFPLSGRAFQYFLEVFLVNRHLPGFQQVDAFVIDIRTENFVTGCRQTCSRHQPDVTTPDYGQTHNSFSLSFSTLLSSRSEGADCLSRPVLIATGFEFAVSLSEKQTTKTEEHQAWLAPDHVPQQPRRFIPANLCQGLSCRNIQYVHQLAVLFLPEGMQRSTNQPVGSQFPAERAQFAPTLSQDRVGDAPGATKSRHDSTDRGYFHLRGGVPYQVDFAVSHFPVDGNPLPVHRDSRTLPLERLESLPCEEPVEGALGVPALLANHAERCAHGRLWNQPVKVWRVIGNKPDPRGVWRAILRQPYKGLYQRHSLYRWPTRRPGHAAHRSVRAHQAPGMQFHSPPTLISLHAQAGAIWRQAHETRVVLDSRSRPFGFRRKIADKPRALDDQVGPLQRDRRRTSVGKQFQATNFVHDACTAGSIYLSAKVVRDDQRA